MGRVHIKLGGDRCDTELRARVLFDAVTRWRLSGPFGRRHTIVIAAVHCSWNVQGVCLRYRAISRRCDNRRVAASAIDIAISPNR